MGGALAALLAVVEPVPATAEEAAAPGLIVGALTAEHPDLESLAKALTRHLLSELGGRYAGMIIGEQEIQARLELEAQRVALDCESESNCLAQMADAIGASRSLTGSVGRLGDNLNVILKLMDPGKARVVADDIVTAATEAELMRAVPDAAARLLGVDGSAARFEIAAVKDKKAAVFDLKPYDVEAGQVGVLTQILALELRQAGLKVTSKDDIDKILALRGLQDALACTSETSCLVDIGGALGVDFLVTGDVGLLGKQYVINLSLLDTKTNAAVSRSSEAFQGDPKHLREAVRFAAWKLLGADLGGAGSTKISANARSGQLSIDGGAKLDYPTTDTIDDLVVGKHTITLKADGFHDLYQEFYVQPNDLTELQLELTELPPPIWMRWWFWTVVGTAVAGGVTATALVLGATPDSGNVSVSLTTER